MCVNILIVIQSCDNNVEYEIYVDILYIYNRSEVFSEQMELKCSKALASSGNCINGINKYNVSLIHN